jgi:tRNA pseudouridine55 synthase
MKSRKTTIHYIKNVEINLPLVSFTVGCSKGTYIRSLAHDIGQSLGVGAYLTLRRTKIGEYSVENAHSRILENEFRFQNNYEKTLSYIAFNFCFRIFSKK